MKRLIIMFLLTICQPTLAQYLQHFSSEKFNYQLTVKTLTNVYGLFGVKRGEAQLSIKTETNQRINLEVQAVIFNNQEKNEIFLKNAANIFIEQGQLKNFGYQLTDSTVNYWLVNNHQHQVYHYNQERVVDSLALLYEPREIITAVLYLMNNGSINLGKTYSTYFINADSGGYCHWEELEVVVAKDKEKIKINDLEIECFRLTFSFANKINLGGHYRLGEPVIWLTAVGRPIKVKVKLYWGFIPVTIITGQLKL